MPKRPIKHPQALGPGPWSLGASIGAAPVSHLPPAECHGHVACAAQLALQRLPRGSRRLPRGAARGGRVGLGVGGGRGDLEIHVAVGHQERPGMDRLQIFDIFLAL